MFTAKCVLQYLKGTADEVVRMRPGKDDQLPEVVDASLGASDKKIERADRVY